MDRINRIYRMLEWAWREASVIPAKAGIHLPGREWGRRGAVVIPAKAGIHLLGREW